MSSNYQLVMTSGPNPGQIFILDGTEFSIGRDINNDFVINDTEMSRKHAKIYIYGQGFVIEDLGSTNGTYINGQRLVGIHQLVSGDSIAFGENVNCTFEVPVFDPDATRVSAQPPSYSPPVSQPPSYGTPVRSASTAVPPLETFISAPPAHQYVSAPGQPSYSGEVPAAYPVGEKPKKKNKVFLIILILFLLFICGCIVFWIVVDSMNLYCDLFPGLMNAIFGSGSCP
jgi:predicted component of type VI protein secretion system